VAISDAQAREILAKLAPDLTSNALDLLQGVARFETGYGNKWAKTKPPCDQGAESNNWGAIKVGKLAVDDAGAWSCDAGGFPCWDEGDVPHCFKTYLTPEAGAKAMVELLLKRKETGDLLRGGGGTPGEMAQAMKKIGYYTTDEKKYAAALKRNIDDMRAALGKWVAGGVAGLSAVAIGFLGWRFSK
jgi:hypothetical protein